jgi:hypothetical protein
MGFAHSHASRANKVGEPTLPAPAMLYWGAGNVSYLNNFMSRCEDARHLAVFSLAKYNSRRDKEQV